MTLHYYMGSEDKLEKLKDKDNDSKIGFIREEISKVMLTKNISFLLGAGCSSLVKDGSENGIPVMSGLVDELKANFPNDRLKTFFNNYKIGECRNLEDFLGYLYRKLQIAKDDKKSRVIKSYEKAIVDIKNFIIQKCLKNDIFVLDIYKKFYRKLMLMRPGNIPRINIFTTNYDLFSERALDSLKILFCNGFSGVVDRYFNPSVFNYNFFKETDTKTAKLTEIDNYFFLYKLHGSVNWFKDEEEKSFFNIKEGLDQNKDTEKIMIYPTPDKYESSMSTPYLDLFREYQRKLMQDNNVLICLGYNFSDAHVNNLIFQAFSIPTFRLIIFSSVGQEKIIINKLKNLDDSRVWIIGGDFEEDSQVVPVHYFKNFVDKILPDLTQQKIDDKIKATSQGLLDVNEV